MYLSGQKGALSQGFHCSEGADCSMSADFSEAIFFFFFCCGKNKSNN